MEVCPEAELIAVEDPATVCDRAFQIGEGRKVAVRERLIQNGPEVLGGLKLGGVRGQVGEPEALRHDQVRCGVPAGAVEPEPDHAIPSRPGLAGKQRQQRGKERLGDAVRDIPEHLAGDRLHEGGDGQPLVAVVTKRDRPLAFGRPHPPDDRLQPDAVLVGRPDFDRRVRVLGPLLGDGLFQLFLNVSRSSGVAAAGWRGRGFCTDQSIAFRASQPRGGKTAASPSSPAIQRATLGPGHRRAAASQAARATAPEARGAARSVRCRSADASHPGPRARVRCSGRVTARSSAGQSSSPPRHPRSCDPALTTRSPESAASRSDPGPTGASLPDRPRSDDQQPAPWLASAPHGAPAYPLFNNPGILNPSPSPGPRIKRALQALGVGGRRYIRADCRLGSRDSSLGPALKLAATRLVSGDLLVVATNTDPKIALAHYRRRWGIETLFAATKTRGFNLEDTHLIHPDRIGKLLAVLAVAFAFAHATGEGQAKHRPIIIKTDKRRAQSIFRVGFDLPRK